MDAGPDRHNLAPTTKYPTLHIKRSPIHVQRAVAYGSHTLLRLENCRAARLAPRTDDGGDAPGRLARRGFRWRRAVVAAGRKAWRLLLLLAVLATAAAEGRVAQQEQDEEDDEQKDDDGQDEGLLLEERDLAVLAEPRRGGLPRQRHRQEDTREWCHRGVSGDDVRLSDCSSLIYGGG